MGGQDGISILSRGRSDAQAAQVPAHALLAPASRLPGPGRAAGVCLVAGTHPATSRWTLACAWRQKILLGERYGELLVTPEVLIAVVEELTQAQCLNEGAGPAD